MRRPHLISLPSLMLVGALSFGCGANLAPVLQVEGAPVAAPSGTTATREAVRDAIVRALASRTWGIVEEKPDGIVAQVTAGGHTASVLVQYDERTYSITYVSSSPGLKYDGTRIHRRYNHWIDRLRSSIAREISQLRPLPVSHN